MRRREKVGLVLDRIAQVLAGVSLGNAGDRSELATLDRGVLEVALLVAALDGSILPAEFAAFASLASACRGPLGDSVRETFDLALRDAGYLMALAHTDWYTEDERVAVFVHLAVGRLPSGFAAGSMADLRRAFVLWVAMGLSDGTLSALERRAIEALRDRYAAVAGHGTLLEADFLVQAEKTLRAFSVSSRCAKAGKALVELVEKMPVSTQDGTDVVRPAGGIGLSLAAVCLAVVSPCRKKKR